MVADFEIDLIALEDFVVLAYGNSSILSFKKHNLV